MASSKKQRRETDLEVDLFGQLSDDIIVSILLRLTLKQAVRTSVLSRRWENLWRFRFGTNIVLCDPRRSYRFQEPRYFVEWVDRILKSSTTQPVDEFAICFKLDLRFSKAVESWIAFALQKNVKRLHLDMVPPYKRPTFPFENSFCMFPNLRKAPTLPNVFNNMKDVYLRGFKIDQIAFGYFFSRCPNLERLHLLRISGVKSLKVVSTTLKYMEVMECINMKVIVSAPNLISLSHESHTPKLELERVSLLSEFSAAGFCIKFFVEQFDKYFKFASQLTTLKLDVPIMMIEQSMSYSQELTVLSVLKHLELTITLDEYQCLLWPICFVTAAPLLHELIVEMRSWPNSGNWWRRKPENVLNKHKCNGRNLKNVKSAGHESLKLVEFRRFSNLENQWELVEQIVKLPHSLEKMAIYIDVGTGYKGDDVDVIYAKGVAERLLAPGIKLEVGNYSTNNYELLELL